MDFGCHTGLLLTVVNDVWTNSVDDLKHRLLCTLNRLLINYAWFKVEILGCLKTKFAIGKRKNVRFSYSIASIGSINLVN